MDDKPAVHGGQIHRAARELGLPLTDILDFSANINPLGPPETIRRALVQALDDISFYPDATQAEARHAIADRYQVPEANVLVSNGATEAIDLVLRAWNPTRVWILEPAFSEYRAAALRNHLTVVSVPLEHPDFTVPWERLVAQARPGDSIIWNNPHNPSGRHIRRRDFGPPLEALLKRGVTMLIDESFMDFLMDSAENTAVSEALRWGSRVVVVRSLTKFLAIPGLRLGYAIADRSWVEHLDRLRDRWSVNHLAQMAATVGLQDQGFRHATAQWLCQEQQRVEAIWGPSALYHRYSTSVNFFLLRWADADLSRRMSQVLFQQGILVRVCQDFQGMGPAYWRVAIRSRVDNDAIYLAVQDFLQGEGARWLRLS
jgi:threonine-phosphate decarboxylase